MTWFKVDDGFYDHPKVIDLPLAAVGLWALAGAYCARHLTDGVITDRQIRAIGGTRKQAAALVAAGLWSADDAPPSARRYAFNDWADFQPARADVEAKREEARERMAAARARKRKTSGNGEMFARTDSERSQEVRSEGLSERSHYPDPTRPDPTRPEVNTASSQPHGEQDASTESASSDPHHPAELAPTIRRLLTAGHSPAAIDTAVAAWIARPRPKGPGLLPHLVADAEATAEAGRAEAQKRELAASKRAATNACDLCDETGQILDDRGRPMAPAIHCTHDEDANAALVLDARQRAEAEAEAEAERRDRAAKAAAQARELRARLAEQRTSA